ncbi:MAG: DUF3089 domain-containing protein [Sphingomonadaceae bacterium]
MARKFLLVIAACIVLVLIAGFAWQMFGTQIARIALVPGGPFVAQTPMTANAWNEPGMWHARPGLADDPAQWRPESVASGPPAQPRVATFFIHPTSYIDRSGWNAPLDNATANERARTFLRGQASVFNDAGTVWAPRYRQATFGAFLTDRADGQRALDAAYRDVAAAWDAFVAQHPADQPIIVAGHSQGALHLMRLLRERIAGQPVAQRIVAAYVVGWPVSMTADLPALGLPACARADQAGCILSWQSFAEPADTAQIEAAFDKTAGPTGLARRGTTMLCTNPLTGTPGAVAPIAANSGGLVPSADLKTATLRTGLVPARCDGKRGFLLIGAPPEDIDSYVLPGNNYHVFDYSLFWSNLRADVARRVGAFGAR